MAIINGKYQPLPGPYLRSLEEAAEDYSTPLISSEIQRGWKPYNADNGEEKNIATILGIIVMTFLSALFLILITLKLIGIIAWSWWAISFFLFLPVIMVLLIILGSWMIYGALLYYRKVMK
jgi:hypothetical protein